MSRNSDSLFNLESKYAVKRYLIGKLCRHNYSKVEVGMLWDVNIRRLRYFNEFKCMCVPDWNEITCTDDNAAMIRHIQTRTKTGFARLILY